MTSGDPRRRYQGTLRLSHNAWLIGFKQLRLGPQMRREKVAGWRTSPILLSNTPLAQAKNAP
jgi:hypothetical protein